MKFEEVSKKCPAIVNTVSGIMACRINDRKCSKQHCVFYYWLDKKKESYK
jgi:hypothetical protein